MKYILSILILFLHHGLFAQKQKILLDKVIAVVGEQMILKSEVDNTFNEYKKQDPNLPDSIKCNILENLLSKYLLCEQGARDSITISDDEVNATLDNRIRYFIQQYGSEERMQEVIGKNSYQLKEEYRKVFYDDLLASRVQNTVMNDVKISPAEVRSFFAKIPKDSLPLLPSQVEVGQLVISPTPSKKAEDYALQQLLDIREQIVSGKVDFETMAGIYNTDATKDNGGDLGVMTRDELVPEFSAVAFRLGTGELSDPVKTRFGYHLILMVKRLGEKARLKHILIQPSVTSDEVAAALNRLDSIKKQIEAGKITWQDAVTKFSTDERTKMTGGMFTNPSTGSSLLAQDELDPEVVLEIGSMTPGQISSPKIHVLDPKGEQKECRLIFLKNISEPHIMDINKDYNRIQQAALTEKQNNYLMKWVESKIGEFYINIDQDYATCNSIGKWLKAKEGKK